MWAVEADMSKPLTQAHITPSSGLWGSYFGGIHQYLARPADLGTWTWTGLACE